MYIINASSISSFPAAIGKSRLTKRDLTSLADIEKAAKAVYLVINPRSKGFPITLPENAHISVLFHIAKRVWEYFNNEPNTPNTQANFDAFHDDLCKDFLARMNALRSGFGLPDLTYGMAQKFINMLFKYLACFSNYPSFADLFSHCHLPIDRQILGAFKTLGVPNVKNGRYKGKNWSELNNVEYKDLLNDYRSVLCPRMGNHSLLAFDFAIWARGNSQPTEVFSELSQSGVAANPISEFFH